MLWKLLIFVFLLDHDQVEHIIREEKMMAAQEIIELFCELIAVRLPIIEVQKYIFTINEQVLGCSFVF